MGWIIFIFSLIILWISFFAISERRFSKYSFWEGILAAALSWFVLLLISLLATASFPRIIHTVDYEPLSMGLTYITDNHCCINKDEKLKIVEIDETNISLDNHKPVIKEHLLTAPKWVTAIYPSTFFEYTEYELIIPLAAD